MAITFTALNYTGTATPDEVRAAKDAIAMENARRAALTPPGTPLPSTTGAEIKSSYLTVLLQNNCQRAHESYVEQARKVDYSARMAKFNASDQATKDAALAAFDAAIGLT